MQGAPLIGNQVVQMRQAGEKRRLTPARMMESLHGEELRHWFSLMGTVLPFEIITYAI